MQTCSQKGLREDKEFHPSRTLATEFVFTPSNCSLLSLVYQENSSRIVHNFPLNPLENQDLDDCIILNSHRHVLFLGYDPSYPSNPEKFPWYQISGDRKGVIPINGLLSSFMDNS